MICSLTTQVGRRVGSSSVQGIGSPTTTCSCLCPSWISRPVQRQFRVALTVQQIQDSPHADGDLPVSRQAEVNSVLRPATAGRSYGYAVLSASKPTVRSSRHGSRRRHRVHAIDGLAGHVDDFLIEDADWSVRFIKVDTRDWGPARRVLLPPRLIRNIDWLARAVHLDVDRREIENRSLHDSGPNADRINDEMFLA